MSLHFKFLTLFLLLFLQAPAALAVPVSFNDLNLVDRDISLYQVNESGSYLVSGDLKTSNATYDLNPVYSYQVVIEPSHLTWFDDPRNALTYFIDDAAGQSITFLVFAVVFVGLVRLVFR